MLLPLKNKINSFKSQFCISSCINIHAQLIAQLMGQILLKCKSLILLITSVFELISPDNLSYSFSSKLYWHSGGHERRSDCTFLYESQRLSYFDDTYSILYHFTRKCCFKYILTLRIAKITTRDPICSVVNYALRPKQKLSTKHS